MTEQSTRLKNQLYKLNRERSLSLVREEQDILNLIISSKKKELKRIKNHKNKLIKELDKLIIRSGRNLTTIPGISTVLAARIAAHTNGIERFQNVDKFIRYAGISPVERSSGKTRRYIKGNKGNRNLNGIFYIASMLQILHNPKAKAYFDKKISEGKTKKHALRCLMKRFAVIVYGMLKNGEDYRIN